MSCALLAGGLTGGTVAAQPATHVPEGDAVSWAVARAARSAAAAHEFGLRVVACDACLADPELALLHALRQTRGTGYEREADQLWYAELNRVADRAACGGGIPREEGCSPQRDLVTELNHLAPGWPRAVELAREVILADIDALAAQPETLDAAVELGHDLLFTHGATPENTAVVARVRRARLDAVLAAPPGSLHARSLPTAAWIRAWSDALALERSTGENLDAVYAQLVDAYLVSFHAGRPLLELEEFTRHVEALHLQKRSEASRALAAATYYRVAWRYWQRTGWFLSSASRARIESHLASARELGHRADPQGLERRLWWIGMWPVTLPLGLLLLLGTLFWRSARPRLRRQARRLLGRAEQLRARGRLLDAAVTAEQAWEVASRLASLDRHDQFLMARAATALLTDALERREMTRAATWADRLSDLPFEYWPDRFESMARRCGIDLSDRVPTP